MALDLIFLLLSIYGQRHYTIKGGVLFPDEMKGSCCSDLSKQVKVHQRVRLLRDVFFHCSLSNYMVEQRSEYERRKGVILTS